MYLKHLNLESFRSFQDLQLDFKPNPGLNIFIGSNGVGKTNILEAIYLLSFPRSFRTRQADSLVKEDSDYYLVEAKFDNFSDKTNVLEVFENQPQTNQLKLGYQQNSNRKIFQRNSVDVDLKDFLSNLQTVMFSPEDLDLVISSPKVRRRFLDLVLYEVDREYFAANIHYYRLLNQRNAILKHSKDISQARADLEIWDIAFIKASLDVFNKRIELIESLQKFLPKSLEVFLQELADDISLVYLASGQSIDLASLNQEFIQKQLEKNLHRDIKTGYSSFGPHRDDFQLLIRQKNVTEFCSRGQLRSLVLGLKLAQINYIESNCLKSPLLLLDDVFSELDSTRRHGLLQLAQNYQTFITAVELSYFNDFEIDYKLFKVDKKQVNLL